MIKGRSTPDFDDCLILQNNLKANKQNKLWNLWTIPQFIPCYSIDRTIRFFFKLDLPFFVDIRHRVRYYIFITDWLTAHVNLSLVEVQSLRAIRLNIIITKCVQIGACFSLYHLYKHQWRKSEAIGYWVSVTVYKTHTKFNSIFYLVTINNKLKIHTYNTITILSRSVTFDQFFFSKYC